MKAFKYNLFLTAFFITFFISVLSFAEEDSFSQIPKDFLKISNPKLKIKLQGILEKRISIHFDNTHIRDIIQYISTVAPLSIIIDETPFAYENTDSNLNNTNNSSNNTEITEISNQIKMSKYILTVHLNDIPIRNILWYLCKKTNLMAFFDEDIDDHSTVPLIITSRETAKKIFQQKMANKRRELMLRRALKTFKKSM